MAQPYATRAKMKNYLNITDTSIDTELDTFITLADNWVDSNLKDVITVPLTTPDDQIKEIASEYGAGLYQLSVTGMDPSKIPAHMIVAEKNLKIYKLGLVESEAAPQKKPMLGKTTGNVTTE